MAIFSTKEKRILSLLLGVTFLSRIALAFRDPLHLTCLPYMDDSFYIFSCARSIAYGHGFTIDGVHLTNGVQPLIAILYAPCFWFSNVWTAIRMTTLVNAIIDSSSVFLIALVCKLLQKTDSQEPLFLPSLFAAGAWTLFYPVLVQTNNGLETGIYSLSILATLCYRLHLMRLSQKAAPLGIAQWMFYGILLGLLVLARIDGAIFVASCVLFDLVNRRVKFLPIFTYGLAALLVSGPWWVYNYAVFGSLVPISGQAEGLGYFDLRTNLYMSIRAIIDAVTVLFTTTIYAWPLWIYAVVLAIAGILFVVLRGTLRISEYLRTNFQLSILTPLAAASGVLVIYYTFFFNAPWFIPRYFMPLRILCLLLASLAMPAIADLIKIQRARHSEWKYYLRLPVLLVAGLLLGFNVYRYGVNFIPQPTNPYYAAAEWAMAHPRARIGMGGSGLGEFFSPNVINLDGKVNPDALQALRSGGRTLADYILSKHLDYLMDWEYNISAHLDALRRNGIQPKWIEQFDGIEVYAMPTAAS